MWLMTKYGFYSIVQKKRGVFHIRARERNDLQNLIKIVPLPNCEIIDTIDEFTDYPHRIITDHSAVMQVLSRLGTELDYPNFKKKITATKDQEYKHDLYYDVWDLVSSALGRYGEPGHLNKGKEERQHAKGIDSKNMLRLR